MWQERNPSHVGSWNSAHRSHRRAPLSFGTMEGHTQASHKKKKTKRTELITYSMSRESSCQAGSQHSWESKGSSKPASKRSRSLWSFPVFGHESRSQSSPHALESIPWFFIKSHSTLLCRCQYWMAIINYWINVISTSLVNKRRQKCRDPIVQKKHEFFPGS